MTTLLGVLLLSVAAACLAAPAGSEEITTGRLLSEMADLERLARWPEPAYRTVQFSSYDRRSTTTEAPGWFSNADGFGGEPIPGFLKMLRPPSGAKPGVYLVAEVDGPGAIVRGWSAGMAGRLRVILDPGPGELGSEAGTVVWDGRADEFLCKRSVRYLASAGVAVEAGDAFVQQDADYLPMPFARGLRVTYEGKLADLHFYHLQVRRYAAGTPVRTFDAARDLKEFEERLGAAVAGLTRPAPPSSAAETELKGDLQPGAVWRWTAPGEGARAIRELRLRLQAADRSAALRGCLLRIAFDGSIRPQVEAPVGDFFASGPGVNPFGSLPFTVEPDGTMAARFVMPFRNAATVEVVNTTAAPVALVGSARVAPWNWDDRSMYFRAKWRADHDLAAGGGPAAIDIPYLVAIGKGVFAGCAAMLMNPSGAPMAGGNWWGEGDEKILVDGETAPSTFGTGSEDYFNYSWSRPDLFSHPYCGQPLDSGPDTSGYVSNHRFQVLDAIPFERSIAAYMELWTHNPTPGLSYARIAYHYALPNAVDDHRALSPSDLRVLALPKRQPAALGAARGATFHLAASLRASATAGGLETAAEPLATQHQVVRWHAEKGARLTLSLPISKNGKAPIRIVAVHAPGGAVVRATLDGKPLTVGRRTNIALRAAHATRVLNVVFAPVEAKQGVRDLVLECFEPGPVGIDYVWVGGY